MACVLPIPSYNWIDTSAQELIHCVIDSPYQCPHYRLHHMSRFIAKMLNIPVIPVGRQHLLGATQNIKEHSYVICIFDDEIVVFYVNLHEKYVCYFDPLDKQPCKALQRFLEGNYKQFVYERIQSPKELIEECINIDLRWAAIMWFITAMEKSVVNEAVNVSELFQLPPEFLNNFYNSLVLLYRQHDTLFPVKNQTDAKAICKNFIKQYITALTFDEKKRSDTYLTLQEQHRILESWKVCKATLHDAVLSLDYEKSFGQGYIRMLREYTEILEVCRESIVSHFSFLIETYKVIEKKNEVVHFQEQIEVAKRVFNILTDVLCVQTRI